MDKKLTFGIMCIFYAAILAIVWYFSELYHPLLGLKIPTNLNVSELCSFYKGGDIGAYCSVGHDIAISAREGLLKNFGEFTLWPPGQFLNFTAATMLLGSKASLFPYFALHNYLLWVGVFITFGYFAGRRLGIVGYMIPLLLLVLPEFTNFLLKVGIYGSDGYGAALFLIAFVILLYQRTPNLITSIFCGGLFGISAYYRSLNESLLILMLFAFMAYYIYSCIAKLVTERGRAKDVFFNAFHKNRFLFLTLIVALLLTMPWRAVTYKVERRLAWTRNLDFEVNSSWYHPEKAAPWFIAMGGGLACQQNPQTCQDFHRRGLEHVKKHEKYPALIKTIIKNPITWVKIKAKIFAEQWLDKYVHENDKVSYWLRLMLLIIFSKYPVGICLQCALSRDDDFRRVVLLGSMFVMSLVVILLVHIEPRYLYMSKILAVIYLIDMAEQLRKYRVKLPCLNRLEFSTKTAGI